MVKHAINESWYESPSAMDVAFRLGASEVTVAPGPPVAPGAGPAPSPNSGFIVIRTAVELEDFDGALESARYARPSELSVLGILTFLSGCSMTVYDSTTSQQTVQSAGAPLSVLAMQSKLVCDATDYSVDLATLVSVAALDDERARLLISLLDRWRRATYLLSESEAGLHDEEAFLGFFHVMELLVGEYEHAQRSAAETRLESFVHHMLESDFKLRGPNLVQQSQLKFSGLKELMLGPDVFSISQRLLYMLDQMGLLDLRTHRLISDLVKLRNEIAHGRASYRAAMIWPLPPHFLITSQHSNLLVVVQIVTARLIAVNFGLDAWTTEWDSVLEVVHPPLDLVKVFVRTQAARTISRQDFDAGAMDWVRPSSVADAALLRKITLAQLEDCMGDYLLGTSNTDELVERVPYAVVLLCDAVDASIAAQCQTLYGILPLDAFGVTNEKDVLRILEDLGFTPVWLRAKLLVP